MTKTEKADEKHMDRVMPTDLTAATTDKYNGTVSCAY